jgi:hypothetical protein
MAPELARAGHLEITGQPRRAAAFRGQSDRRPLAK